MQAALNRRFVKLPRSFYLRSTLKVARDLLGTYLYRCVGKTILVGRIVEVEAYLGANDPASHAYRGKTKRNEVMFMKGGHLYVYFTYGMHFCSNVVTGKEGIGNAVLLRAIEPVRSIEIMERNRLAARRGARYPSPVSRAQRALDIHHLCSGPARLCQAFALGRKDNGVDLCGTRIWLAKDAYGESSICIGSSTRVGISNGTHHRWRFFIKGNPFVSRTKPTGAR